MFKLFNDDYRISEWGLKIVQANIIKYNMNRRIKMVELGLIGSKRRSWVKMGLEIGQVMPLDEKFRGIGKSSMIAEKARSLGASVIYSSASLARLMEERYVGLVAYSASENLRGMRDIFMVDDITESQYAKVQKEVGANNIVCGVIRKDQQVDRLIDKLPKKDPDDLFTPTKLANANDPKASISISFDNLIAMSESEFNKGKDRLTSILQ